MKQFIILCLGAVMALSSCEINQGRAGNYYRKAERQLVKHVEKEAQKYGKELVERVGSKARQRSAKQEYVSKYDESELLMVKDQRERESTILYRKGYTTSYNRDTRIPNWVGWVLTADHTSGKNKRNNIQFHEDYDVESPRATHYDYMRSGFDRGHMCPAGDNKWDAKAIEQTFLMTNICPQDGGLNRGDWNDLEIKCRNWAREFGKVYIICGPILYNQKHKTIGKDKVTVPEAFFKVVLCLEGNPKGIGFIYKNQSGKKDLRNYTNSIDDVERITGFDFFSNLPDDIETQVESTYDLGEW